MYSLLLAGAHYPNVSSATRLTQLKNQIQNLSDFSSVIILTNSSSLSDFIEKSENISFYQIPPRTSGALATAAYGLSKIPKGAPFLIVPSNSIIENDGIELFQRAMHGKSVDVGAIVFEATDPIFSFARIDSEGAISEIIEKKVAGSCALAGVYYFDNSDLLSKCVEWAMVNNVSINGNFYISPALNYFLANSISISLHEIPFQDYRRF